MKKRVTAVGLGAAAVLAIIAAWSSLPLSAQSATTPKSSVVLLSVTVPAGSAQVCLTVHTQALGCTPLPSSDVVVSVQLKADNDRTSIAGSAAVQQCASGGGRVIVTSTTEGFVRVSLEAAGQTVADTDWIALATDGDANIGFCRGTT